MSIKLLFPRAFALLALILILTLAGLRQMSSAKRAQAAGQGLAGRVTDSQQQPVASARITLYLNNGRNSTAATTSQDNGSFLIVIPPEKTIESARLEIEHPHFSPLRVELTGNDLSLLQDHRSMVLGDLKLERQITWSFWLTAAIFILMLVLIANEDFHNTLAALLAVALLFIASLVGGTFTPQLFIYDFEHALRFVDFDVIFLLLGMMIVIGVIEETGIFQWLALRAYKLSQGKVWLLTIILMLVTVVTSALLDNVTTMLLISPITLEIALTLGINPLSLLIPAVMASNTGGTLTLVGTPTNILVGSYANLQFNDFLLNLTPGVVLSLAVLVGFMLWVYRKEHRATKKPSARLMRRLEQNARIKDPHKLRKAGIVFGGLLLLFVFGESFHLTPAVSAIIGSVVMLLWVHPHIEQMMQVVDWTTLIFFIALFMVIGAVQEVGILALLGDQINRLVNGNLVVGILMVTWIGAVLAGFVNHIPLTAALLPIVSLLARTVPGGHQAALFFALAVGTGMGGNTSIISSSANLVTAGIADRAGYKIGFKRFLKVSVPATALTVGVACLWLVFHFT